MAGFSDGAVGAADHPGAANDVSVQPTAKNLGAAAGEEEAKGGGEIESGSIARAGGEVVLFNLTLL